MRRRRPDAGGTGDATADTVDEAIQTDDEDTKRIIKKAVSTKVRTRTQEIEEAFVTVHRSVMERKRFIFPLGLLFGVLLAYMFFPPIPPHLMMMLEEYDMSSTLLKNASFQFEWRQLTGTIFDAANAWRTTRDFQIGTELAERGLSAKYPVVLIPGIVSTGLESWSTSPEYRQYFRKRLWGTTTMITAVLADKDRWVNALMLDPETGLDPPGAKIRAAQGVDAASTFIPGYWIWSKVIENLACINYDTNNMEMAAYDWRLSYYNLEVRDGYFSRLKSTIEAFKSVHFTISKIDAPFDPDIRKREGRKVVLIGHSMGSTVILYFMKWAEAPGFGDGGPKWVDDHIESFVNVAGPMLGVPKAMTAFLSGEMKDTVEVNPAGSYVLERFFSRKDRAKLFRSWAGSASMWIKGGDAIWGSNTEAPDDLEGTIHTHGHFFSFKAPTPDTASSSLPAGHSATSAGAEVHPSMQPLDADAKKRAASTDGPSKPVPPIPPEEMSPGVGNLTAEDSGTWILEHTPVSYQKMMWSNYSYGIERDEKQLKLNGLDHRKWTNPLEIQLPDAPHMKIFCLHGHGKETERSYWYARGHYESDEVMVDGVKPVCSNSATECDEKAMTSRAALDLPMTRQTWIDATVSKDTDVPKVKNGVKMGEGDGTVPSLSLGAMCVEGWKRKRWNPAGIKVVTYEMAHKPEEFDLRGGATTADHIDILGSSALNEIVLKVAAGYSDDIEDHFVSNIREYAQKIAWD